MFSVKLRSAAVAITALSIPLLGAASSASASTHAAHNSAGAPSVSGTVIIGSKTHTVEVPPSAAAPRRTLATVSSIVCGGQKSGSGWKTWPSGGYVGEGCGAGIDYVATPTSATSLYDFGFTNGGTYTFQAWIPTVHATALMDFTIFACGANVGDVTVNEAPISGWKTLGSLSGFSGCDIEILAWSGVQHSEELGLDAIRSHT